MTSPASEEVILKVTADEALVLFDFLQRFSSTNKLSIEDQAEERALWNLTCVVERSLPQTFSPAYDQELKQAKDRLRDET